MEFPVWEGPLAQVSEAEQVRLLERLWARMSTRLSSAEVATASVEWVSAVELREALARLIRTGQIYIVAGRGTS